MCNINLAIDTRKKNNRLLRETINAMSFISFANNGDGDGFICVNDDNIVFMEKSTKKLICRNDAYLFISHQRMATQGGIIDDFSHPFETENFILVHNGCLSGYYNYNKSDTLQYVEDLDLYYNVNKKDLLSAICKLHKDTNQRGSFSILVYEKSTQKLYYYKSTNTTFYISQTKNYILGSTILKNVELAQTYIKQKDEINTLSPYVIYDVLDKWKVVAYIDQPIIEAPKYAFRGGYDFYGCKPNKKRKKQYYEGYDIWNIE